MIGGVERSLEVLVAYPVFASISFFNHEITIHVSPVMIDLDNT